MAISPRSAKNVAKSPATRESAKPSDAVYLKCATRDCLQAAQVIVRDPTSRETIWLCGKCTKLLGERVERVGKASLTSPFEA